MQLLSHFSFPTKPALPVKKIAFPKEESLILLCSSEKIGPQYPVLYHFTIDLISLLTA